MLLPILRFLRRVTRILIEKEAPHRLALGFALGMMIGLVPKGNLVAIVLSTILLATRSDLIAGGLAAAAFSWIGMLADPLSHRLGLAILTREAWDPCWSELYKLPLVPWTRLNNTVVLGSLLLGIALFYPVYRLSRAAFERCRGRFIKDVEKDPAHSMPARAQAVLNGRVP